MLIHLRISQEALFGNYVTFAEEVTPQIDARKEPLFKHESAPNFQYCKNHWDVRLFSPSSDEVDRRFVLEIIDKSTVSDSLPVGCKPISFAISEQKKGCLIRAVLLRATVLGMEAEHEQNCASYDTGNGFSDSIERSSQQFESSAPHSSTYFNSQSVSAINRFDVKGKGNKNSLVKDGSTSQAPPVSLVENEGLKSSKEIYEKLFGSATSASVSSLEDSPNTVDLTLASQEIADDLTFTALDISSAIDLSEKKKLESKAAVCFNFDNLWVDSIDDFRKKIIEQKGLVSWYKLVLLLSSGQTLYDYFNLALRFTFKNNNVIDDNACTVSKTSVWVYEESSLLPFELDKVDSKLFNNTEYTAVFINAFIEVLYQNFEKQLVFQNAMLHLVYISEIMAVADLDFFHEVTQNLLDSKAELDFCLDNGRFSKSLLGDPIMYYFRYFDGGALEVSGILHDELIESQVNFCKATVLGSEQYRDVISSLLHSRLSFRSTDS